MLIVILKQTEFKFKLYKFNYNVILLLYLFNDLFPGQPG